MATSWGRHQELGLRKPCAPQAVENSMPVVLEVCCLLSNEHVLPNRLPMTKSPEQSQTPDLAIMRYPGACREEWGRLFDIRATRATWRGHASIARKSRVTDTENTVMLSGGLMSVWAPNISLFHHDWILWILDARDKGYVFPMPLKERYRSIIGTPS